MMLLIHVVNSCSDVLLYFLAELLPKLDHTSPALLIGNIVTSILTNRPTTLQLTLGTVLIDKALIHLCSEYGICCSYDEVLRFRKSAAHATSQEKHLQGLMQDLIQAVADDFDANISSPNGLKSTHSFAFLFTQLQNILKMKTVPPSEDSESRNSRRKYHHQLKCSTTMDLKNLPCQMTSPSTKCSH